MAYSIERKEAILKKLLPPVNQTVAEVVRIEGLSVNTLYQWRDKARQSGLPVPGKTKALITGSFGEFEFNASYQCPVETFS